MICLNVCTVTKNILLKKPTRSAPTKATAIAAYCNDGILTYRSNLDKHQEQKLCIMLERKDPFWEVDLLLSYRVSKVFVTSPNDARGK